MTEFLDALLQSDQRVVSRVWLYYGGVEVLGGPVPVSDGWVEIDAKAQRRRRCQVTVPAEFASLIPRTPLDRLAPYGAELFIERGVVIDGREVMQPLGFFRIDTDDIEDAGTGIEITIDGLDRSQAVSDFRLLKAVVREPGTKAVDLIRALLNDALPDVGLEADDSDVELPLQVIERQSDPWEKATDVATSLGMELLFDQMGKPRLRRIIEQGAAVDRYVVGPESKIISIRRRVTSKPGYNGVFVIGTPPGLPEVTGESWDTDPTSPTRVDVYGHKPMFFVSELIRTELQAYEAAQALRLTKVGGTEEIRMNVIPNSSLDANQLIEVSHDAIGAQGNWLTDTMRIPLRENGSMSITAQSRRWVA